MADLICAGRPDIVLHLAAQPLVRLSYADPAPTFGSTVMRTVHLLEALRQHAQPEAMVVASFRQACFTQRGIPRVPRAVEMSSVAVIFWPTDWFAMQCGR
ncbi:MAG: GDP-mannose 4,6-dehydratase [Paracoccaceae bacterium]